MDPELRFTPSGVALARVLFAVNRRYQSKGEWQEETSFFEGTVWGDMAENVAETLTRGMRVIVFGDLQQRSWETKEGEKRSTIDIRVNEIGPSLRWATANVTKTPRSEGGGWSNQGQSPSKPAAPVARPQGPDEAPF
jgi:single-strand DNA-binding protein